jgi:hypothetical protein
MCFARYVIIHIWIICMMKLVYLVDVKVRVLKILPNWRMHASHGGEEEYG